MLSDKELSFIEYWKDRRLPYSSLQSKIARGLPMATLFCVPVIILLIVVYLFFPDWYAKLAPSFGSVVVTVIALFIAMIFMAFFRMHFNWEMNEQVYQQLLKKREMEDEFTGKQNQY